jgi:hypothetical protein
VEPGRYGFNSVWTRFEIRLCVTAFPECIPHSKLFLTISTRVDLHLIPDSPALTLVDPQRQTSKKACETGSSPCWTVSNRSDSYRAVLTLFIFRWPTFKSAYTKTVSSRFYPDCMQITIYSGTIPADFHLHQIRFVTRLYVTVALQLGLRKPFSW